VAGAILVALTAFVLSGRGNTSETGAPPAAPATASPAAGSAGPVPSPSVTGPSASPTRIGPGGPIGSGWTELFPKTKLDHPPNLMRYAFVGGEHHFWVLASDPSAYPGRDSGPRSELRIYNDYTSGQAQFQADIKVMPGCFRASIMQIFGAATQATAFMAWAMPDQLAYYGGTRIYAPLYNRYLRLNVIHDTATGVITVYVDGVARGTFHDHGAATHYFKVGVYHQKDMSDRCDVYVRNIHVYHR
jgi:alginate lyase